MTITLEGLGSVGGDETRALAYLKVNHRNQIYDWQAFVPNGQDLDTFLNQIESIVKAQIDAKELEWERLDPKTRQITNPFTGQMDLVDIDKSEIVRPDIPDYYAKRRQEYPSLGDQLDALWKGGQHQLDMLEKINWVKSKYPKG